MKIANEVPAAVLVMDVIMTISEPLYVLYLLRKQ